jgi:hypothetical protein
MLEKMEATIAFLDPNDPYLGVEALIKHGFKIEVLDRDAYFFDLLPDDVRWIERVDVRARITLEIDSAAPEL